MANQSNPNFHRSKWVRQDKSQSPGILISPLDLDTITGLTLPEFLFKNILNWSSLPVIKCGATGRQYSYGELYTKSRNFAAALLSNGFKRQDVICILLQNSPEYLVVYLGLLQAGIIVCPVNPTFTKEELSYIIRDSCANSVITTPNLIPLVHSVWDECRSLTEKLIVISDDKVVDCHSYIDMIEVNSDNMELLKGSEIDTTTTTCLLAASSGTTGLPKCVEHTHTSLISALMQFIHPLFCHTNMTTDKTCQDRYIAVLPFYHLLGLHVVLATALYHGVYMYSLPKFHPYSYLTALREHKPTTLHLVTPLINWLVEDNSVTSSELDSCQLILISGSPVGTELMEKFQTKFGTRIPIQQAYGMTEIIVPLMTPKNTLFTGSTGVLTPGVSCKVIDNTSGETLGPNQRGEMCFRTPAVMKGYLGNVEATKETIKHGFVHSGDVGYYDKHGFFYIVDRLKDIIKVKAFQVAPSELENVLRQHPQISDVAVVGVKHDKMGETPRAYVVKKNNKLTEQEIHVFLNNKLAPYKQLNGGIEFIEKIPRSLSGKILRRELLEKYCELINIKIV